MANEVLELIILRNKLIKQTANNLRDFYQRTVLVI